MVATSNSIFLQILFFGSSSHHDFGSGNVLLPDADLSHADVSETVVDDQLIEIDD